ncbi:hypothetical protein Tco_0110888 [Tanacetum coccineum]
MFLVSAVTYTLSTRFELGRDIFRELTMALWTKVSTSIRIRITMDSLCSCLRYPEYLVPSDDEAPMEDQPLPADASPIALSPSYVADSNLEEDSEEDSEEDHANYPVDGGDDDDEPFDDDDDDDDDDTGDEDEEPFKDEEDDEEEEEHLAPADSSVIPITDHVPSAKDTEALETDEALFCTYTCTIT